MIQQMSLQNIFKNPPFLLKRKLRLISANVFAFYFSERTEKHMWRNSTPFHITPPMKHCTQCLCLLENEPPMAYLKPFSLLG